MNKCLLMIAVSVCVPNATEAQVPRFFKPTAASRQTHVPGGRQTERRQRPIAAVASRVRQVQLEELIPDPIVPSALSEATIPGLDAAPAMDFDTGSIAPPVETIEAPPAMQNYSGDSYGEPSYSQPYHEPVSISGPPMAVSEVLAGESIVDSGYGQPYDIPLNDVIPSQAAETYSTSDWFRNGNWYSRQELVMLLRADLPHQHIAMDRSILQPFIIQSGPNAGQTSFQPISDPNITNSLSTKSTDFTYEAGTRLTLGHRIGRDPANRDHSIEFTFHGLFDYSSSASLSQTSTGQDLGIFALFASEETVFSSLTRSVGFASLNPINGLDRSEIVDVLHRADFNSFELNYVLGARPAKDRLVMQPDGRWVRHATPSKVRGVFAGLRYIRQNDLFRYRGLGETQATGPANFDVGGTYLVKTGNDLVGIQLGGEFVQKRTDWVFGLKGKVGGLINFADRLNRLTTTALPPAPAAAVLTTTVNEAKSNDETLTFLTEGGAYAAFYIRPNTALRFGYDILYMNGMATATNNLSIRGDQFARFEMTGDSLYHGMNFGFEMTW